MENEILALVGIGLCIFIFLAVLLAMGSVYGGNWSTVAQGITPFIVVITIFAYGAYILVKLMGRR